MQEIREIEMLPTISEDDTDREHATQKNFTGSRNESAALLKAALTPLLASSKIQIGE